MKPLKLRRQKTPAPAPKLTSGYQQVTHEQYSQQPKAAAFERAAGEAVEKGLGTDKVMLAEETVETLDYTEGQIGKYYTTNLYVHKSGEIVPSGEKIFVQLRRSGFTKEEKLEALYERGYITTQVDPQAMRLLDAAGIIDVNRAKLEKSHALELENRMPATLTLLQEAAKLTALQRKAGKTLKTAQTGGADAGALRAQIKEVSSAYASAAANLESLLVACEEIAQAWKSAADAVKETKLTQQAKADLATASESLEGAQENINGALAIAAVERKHAYGVKAAADAVAKEQREIRESLGA